MLTIFFKHIFIAIQICFLIKANWSSIKHSVLRSLTSATVAAGTVAVVAPAATVPIIAAASAPIIASAATSTESVDNHKCRISRRRYSRNDDSEDDEREEREREREERERDREERERDREERERMWKAVKELDKNSKLMLQHVRGKTPPANPRRRK